MSNTMDIHNYYVKMKYAHRDFNGNFSSYSNGLSGEVKEALAIRRKFPTKIPIIVERYYREKDLPHLDKRKFLVPQELTMLQFVNLIRNRMEISPNKALFLLVNNRSMISLTRTIAETYAEYRNMDGFLCITYASQEVFG